MLAKSASFLPQSCIAIGSDDGHSEIHVDV